MSYTGIGENIVVSPAGEAAARARAAAVVKQNATLLAKYEAEVTRYNAAKALRQKLMSAYAHDHKLYTDALGRYQAEVQKIESRNRGAGTSYSQAYSQWKIARDRYAASLAERTRLLNQQKAQSDAALRKVTPPSGYAGCVTQAQHDAWAKTCAQKPNVTVKGLGSMLFGLSGDSAECLWAALPVCVALPALPADPGSEPQKPRFLPLPTPPREPASPKLPEIPPLPKKPALTEVPTVVVQDDLPPPPMAPGAQPKSFAVAGLIALVVVGGGAAYYLTHKKKKVAA